MRIILKEKELLLFKKPCVSWMKRFEKILKWDNEEETEKYEYRPYCGKK